MHNHSNFKQDHLLSYSESPAATANLAPDEFLRVLLLQRTGEKRQEIIEEMCEDSLQNTTLLRGGIPAPNNTNDSNLKSFMSLSSLLSEHNTGDNI